MASFKDRIIETISNDLEQIKKIGNPKEIRKECGMLLQRVESAKKLFTTDQDQLKKLIELELKLKKLKES